MGPKRLLESVLLVSGFAGVISAAYAEAIYKYVDDKGSVTYSSVRLKGGGKAEKLDAPEAPSAEDVAAARRQAELDKQQIKQYEDERRELEAAEAAYLQQAQFASQQEVTAGEAEGSVYYPVWGFSPPFRRIRPWPKPLEPKSPHTQSHSAARMSRQALR